MAALEERIALVTGAGAGLGRAIALRFAAEGAHVVAVSLHESELDELRVVAGAKGLPISAIAADVGDERQTEKLAAEVLERHGRLDILVNNAGIIAVAAIEDTSTEEWDRIVRTNLRGPFLYCRAFAPAMKHRRAGTIINVSSQSGIRGFVGESAYCPSKFGLEGLTQTLALELAPWDVRVVSVTPGAPMHTPMSETTYADAQRAVWVDPAELAGGFVSLASAAGAWISGGRYDVHQLVVTGLAGLGDRTEAVG